ncbi:hypothetical protein [Fluviicola sp.]|uniref:hypothetical protein n=1 Tax=Fluviicola sp. TaxID=1917219 RepID=UPI00262C6A99|nr:hypothetical protein [Fluviicola sp.]
MMVFTFLFGSIATAQDVVVIGTVSNDQNQKVVGAEVRLGQQNSKTNSKGRFVFKLAKFPAQLSIKHVLYKEYIGFVRAPINQKDTVFLNIILENKATELEEVTINSSRVIWAYQKLHTHIIDFALMDDEILLLCQEDHKYFLRRLDSLSKKITDLQIKKNPQNLFEDCTGGIHLAYTDSLFEFKFWGNSISMLAGYPYIQAMDILSPCVISSENNFIVKRLGPHNKLVEYTKIDRNTKIPELLYITTDRKQMRALDDYAIANDIPVPLFNPNYRNTRGPQIASLTDRQKWQNQQFYRQILSKELYTPIFEINDSIIIFDHIKDSALVFKQNGDFVRSFQISYHYFENWKNELIVNEEKTKIYAKYEIDGLATLREIDPSTGKILNTTLLEKHIYPMRIQVRGNYAFYLYKHYLDNSIHYLYKQALRNN